MAEDKVPVDRLMAELRERVRKGQASYGQPAMTELQKNVQEMNAAWNVSAHLPILWENPIWGRAIAITKRVVRRLLRWYINPIVEQQNTFNAAVARAVTTLAANEARLVHEHEERLGRLERRMVSSSLASSAQVSEQRTLDAGQQPTIDYYLFELKHRGSSEEIRERQKAYLPHFAGCRSVLDIGCGRGEFLELLRENGIGARGVELNPDMVEHCRARGLDVTQGDALACLATLPDGSLDGVFAAQVIEHLQPSELLWLLSLCHDKLAPGGTLVAETNNPLCLTANVTPFLLDLSHVKPIHPQTIEFLLESLGFENIELCFTSPVPDEARLKPVPIPPAMKPAERERWEAVNRSIASLNDLLYGYQDYAVIAKKAYQE